MAAKRRGRTKLIRTLPFLESERPAAVRLEARDGPSRVVASTWRDPSDITPSAARTAREVHGYRSYCPLRRCRDQHGERCSFTEAHIAAADELRRLADAVLIGFSGSREFLPVTEARYGPLLGPGSPALRSARAWRPYQRAMARFAACQRDLVAHCLLLNWSVTRWALWRQEQGIPATPALETGKLVAVLDILAEHFQPELERRGAYAH